MKGPLVIGPVLQLGEKEGIPISLRVSISRFSKFMDSWRDPPAPATMILALRHTNLLLHALGTVSPHESSLAANLNRLFSGSTAKLPSCIHGPISKGPGGLQKQPRSSHTPRTRYPSMKAASKLWNLEPAVIPRRISLEASSHNLQIPEQSCCHDSPSVALNPRCRDQRWGHPCQ